jgi:adenylylsulfate kinase
MNNKTVYFWFTGLSGSGKSTLAEKVFDYFIKKNKKVKLLDGDEMRNGIHSDLDFSKEGILKNNKRVIQLCHNYNGVFDIVLVSVITPFQASRISNRKELGEQLVEIYVKTSIETVCKRDIKGLYKKALKGEINNFIGIDPSVPFEEPVNPDIIVDTEIETDIESFKKIIAITNKSDK